MQFVLWSLWVFTSLQRFIKSSPGRLLPLYYYWLGSNVMKNLKTKENKYGTSFLPFYHFVLTVYLGKKVFWPVNETRHWNFLTLLYLGFFFFHGPKVVPNPFNYTGLATPCTVYSYVHEVHSASYVNCRFRKSFRSVGPTPERKS